MNESLLLNWLVQDAKEHENLHYSPINNLEEALFELNNRHEKSLPKSLPKEPKNMISILREHFKDNVDFISLVLNHHFPEKYFFYRVSKLEKEIFEGFEFFSGIAPEFRFGFPKVGGTGFGRYLKLNGSLLQFVHTHWPGLKAPQKRLTYFLYQGLGQLFLEKSEYSRYWVVATHEEYFDDFDSRNKDVTWSGRKGMQSGDLVFVYRTAPRKAITDILQVKEEPYFDPWGAWDGFWVELKKVCTIEDIPFAEMSKDDVLGKWGTVKKHFEGTVTEPIPPVIYNRLLGMVPDAIREKRRLEFAPVAPPPPQPPSMEKIPGLPPPPTPPTMATPHLSGQFAVEAKFEEEVVVPLLKRLGLKYSAQFICPFRIGSQDHHGEVDFYVSDEAGPLTLFEDKFRILSDNDLKPAVDQAKSYALLLGLPSFVVASPEGMWLYSLDRNQEKLVSQLSAEGVNPEEEFKSLLLRLRQ